MTRKRWVALWLTTMLVAFGTFGAQAQTPLDGTWSVDLTSDPAKPYYKPMALKLRPDGSVTGSFYDSEIVGGRWKSSAGRLCVSFRTTDGRGPYHTSACTSGDRVDGQTWAEHRMFLFLWTAQRPMPAQ